MANTMMLLAEAVSQVFVSGPQGPVTITATGRRFDTDRKVRVETDDLVWEGTIDEWKAALAAALKA